MIAPEPRACILDIKPYVGGKSTVAGQARVIKLSSNESALGPSPKAIAAYGAVADRLHRYPDGGALALREAIAAHYRLAAAQIVCGAGSDELISLLIHAYAAPGEEVLYSQYGFEMYRISTRSAGAIPVAAPERDWRADVDALLARVSERTRLVLLANPNNPTGSYLSAAEVARLHAGLPPRVLLVLDAAYAEFVLRNDYSAGTELVSAHANVAMLRTFSKVHGLAALRLGWGYFSPAVADVLNRVRGPFNVNAPAQAAGIAAIADAAHVAAAVRHNETWRAWLADRLSELGLEVLPSVANFLLVRFPSDARHASPAAAEFLMAARIIPRATASYGLPEFLRITIGREEECRAVVAALAEFLATR